MKKLTAIFTLFVVILAGCGAPEPSGTMDSQPQSDSIISSAQPPASTAPEAQSGSPSSSSTLDSTAPAPVPKLSGAYSDAMKSGRFYITFTTDIDLDGISVQMDAAAASDGGATAMLTRIPAPDGKIMESRVLIKDGKSYMIDDNAKSYMQMDAATVEIPIGGYTSMVYAGDGSGEIDGRSLPYEEYAGTDGFIRFYFDGQNLFAISTQPDSGGMIMLVTEFSDKIPADILELPADYVKIG